MVHAAELSQSNKKTPHPNHWHMYVWVSSLCQYVFLSPDRKRLVSSSRLLATFLYEVGCMDTCQATSASRRQRQRAYYASETTHFTSMLLISTQNIPDKQPCQCCLMGPAQARLSSREPTTDYDHRSVPKLLPYSWPVHQHSFNNHTYRMPARRRQFKGLIMGLKSSSGFNLCAFTESSCSFKSGKHSSTQLLPSYG